MVAMVKAGVELAFETMTAAGIKAESAYYESLHEVPLIANTIARKKLFEMNSTISDTAEYGCYLYNHACLPLLAEFMTDLETDVIGRGLGLNDVGVDNQVLIAVNFEIPQSSRGSHRSNASGLYDGDESHRLKGSLWRIAPAGRGLNEPACDARSSDGYCF